MQDHDQRFIVEAFHDLWRVRDSRFEGPGSVFDGPVKCCVTTRRAASHVAEQFERGELDV